MPLCCSSQVDLLAFVTYHTITLTFMINVRFFFQIKAPLATEISFAKTKAI